VAGARRLIVGGVLAASLLVTPATPATAETTVKVDGNVLRITMTVDVVDAKGQTSPDGTMSLVDYWEKVLNDTWGAAFNQLPYKTCFKLELKVNLKERGDGFDAKKGNHRIIVGAASGGSFEGTGFEGSSETTRNSKTGDGTRSFENDRDGAIPVDAPPTVVAHEFGHLFGLGDDRKNGAPKTGRDGTMMVGGVAGVDVNVVQKIDQNLIDRIGEAVRKHLENQGKKLPKCDTWKGPISSTYTNVTPCMGSDQGTITVGVVGKDASGTVAVSGSYTCTTELFTVTGAGTVTFGVTGTFTGDEFRLLWEPPFVTTGDGPSAYCGAIPERPIVVPVTERGTAQASFEHAITGGQFTCEITLERQSDDEPVG